MRSLINNSLPALLFIFSAVIFSAGLEGDFVMDDWPVVKENSKITDAKYIPDYFTQGVWSNTDLAGQAGVIDRSLYRPVFLLTLNLAYQLWGDNASGFHALSLALHGVNTVLVYFLILGFILPTQRTIAGIGAALFAAHPVHVESVAWIAGMTDPLVSVFLLSGFLLHRRLYRTNTQKTYLLYNLGSFLCFSLAILSKETAIFFPLLLFVYDAMFQRSTLGSKLNITRYLIYATILLVYFLVRDSALSNDGLQQAGILARIDIGNFPTLLEFFTHYIKLLIFPSPLEYYYTPPTASSWTLGIGGLLFVSALIYLPRALKQNQPLYVLAITWIIVTLLPALPIALFDEPVFAQRVLYLPVVGFSMLIAWSLQNAQRYVHPVETTAKTLALGLLVIFSVASIFEIADWKNDTIFYNQAIKASPDSFKPVAGLALVYERDKNRNNKTAIDLYLKAAELAHREADKIDFWENAARIYGQIGNTRNSEALYHDIVQRVPTRSSAWVGLGNNALTQGDRQQALGYYQKAYETDPRNRIASYNLALVYQQLGDFERAAFFQGIAQKP